MIAKVSIAISMTVTGDATPARIRQIVDDRIAARFRVGESGTGGNCRIVTDAIQVDVEEVIKPS